MFIHSYQEALDAVAEILDLPNRRDQIISSTVKIMQCLEADARDFMAQCQALLLEGGLDALRRRRADFATPGDAAEPIIILDPEGDVLFEEIAASLDALRLAPVVKRVFSGLRHDRWQVARALIAREEEIREHLETAVRAHGLGDRYRRSSEAVEAIVNAQRPAWADRASQMRAACRDAVREIYGLAGTELATESDVIFQLIAASEERARAFLWSAGSDPEEARRIVTEVREVVDELNSVHASGTKAAA